MSSGIGTLFPMDISGIGTFAPSRQSSLLTGLMHYWSLDEVSGARNDSVGVAHLTDNNTVGSIAGKHNNAASFVAANSETLTDNADAVTVFTNHLSVSVWFYFDTPSGNFRGLLGKRGTDGWSLQMGNIAPPGPYLFLFSNDQGANEAANLPSALVQNATWTHYVVVYDGTQPTNATKVHVYLNGVEQTPLTFTGTQAATLKADAAHFTIGSGGSGNSWGGHIDEVGLWNRSLTQAEVTTLYNAGAGKFYPTF